MASEAMRELSAYLAGGRVRAYHYGAWELLRKFVAANRSLSLMAVVALLILAALVANVVRQLQTTRLDLRPTITVDQGTKINIYVNKDLTFPQLTDQSFVQ